MKLPKVKIKSLPVVISGIVIITATTAGALVVTKNSNNNQKSNAENITSNEVTNSPTPSVTPAPTETPAPTTSVKPTPSSTPTPSTAPVASNPYPNGTMTNYVYEKRVSAGKVVGSWGNPNTWPSQAKSAGLLVDHTPQVNDAAYSSGGIWFVESVNSDGTVSMTSFNTPYDTGLTTHIFPANQISSFQFIH